MGKSRETYGKKEVKKRQEQARKVKEQKRAKKKSEGKKTSFDDMIAYVDEFGKISSTPPDPGKKTVVKADEIELKITRNTPEMAQDFVRKGIVSFFNESKGFGFIRDLGSNERVFFHANSLLEPVAENNVVTFELGKGPRGASAMKVSLFKEEQKKEE